MSHHIVIDDRFVVAGISSRDRAAIIFAAKHLGAHFGLEVAPMSLAPSVIDIARNRGATGLVVSEIETESEAEWIRANDGVVIHIRSYKDYRPSISYQGQTDRLVVDAGNVDRVKANLEAIVVEAIRKVQRRYTRFLREQQL